MLKNLLLLIAVSVVILGMSIDNINNTVGGVEELSNAMALLDLHTGVPACGYDFTNLMELMNFMAGADNLCELGYASVSGVLVYAIKINNLIYSVHPQIFHSLIFILLN